VARQCLPAGCSCWLARSSNGARASPGAASHKLSANPFDEIALEETLRLRDKGIATEVVVATIAPADAQAHLRNDLAMVANRAIHVVVDGPIQPLTAVLDYPA
jgi:electron transfer flavoprotein alpha/beta subunit